MNNFRGKVFHFFTMLSLSLLVINCNDNDSVGIVENNFSYSADEYLNLDSFPSKIYLEIGKSVYIKNGNVIFRFIEVFENNEINSSISIQVEYANVSNKIIILNTNNIPQTYYLENGFYYNIHLKEVNLTNNKFQIMFIFNKYARL